MRGVRSCVPNAALLRYSLIATLKTKGKSGLNLTVRQHHTCSRLGPTTVTPHKMRRDGQILSPVVHGLANATAASVIEFAEH